MTKTARGEAMAEPIQVALVDDDPTIRQRVAGALSTDARFRTVWTAATVAQACAALADQAPDVLLVDLGLPDGTGIQVIQAAKARSPDCDVLVISVFADQRNVITSIEAGATGYLLKDDREEDYIARILELRNGGSPITPIIARQLLHRFQVRTSASAIESPLSAREEQVLGLLARGFSYQDIANLLGVSPHTVGTYVKRLYEKLQVNSRSEAIFEARHLGILRD